MKRRILSCMLAVTLLAALLSGCGQKGGGAIKIGLTVPLSGDRAAEGSYASNAAKLVEEEINAAGGVLGREIKIEIQDSTGTDVGATNAYLKLAADKDIVAIIGPDNSNDNIAIASSAESSKILTTGQGSSPALRLRRRFSSPCRREMSWRCPLIFLLTVRPFSRTAWLRNSSCPMGRRWMKRPSLAPP